MLIWRLLCWLAKSIATVVTDTPLTSWESDAFYTFSHHHVSTHLLLNVFYLLLLSTDHQRMFTCLQSSARNTVQSSFVWVGNPDTTHVVESLTLCSPQCSKTDNCLYFNYITSPNQQPACQLYNSEPPNTIVDPHCTLFQVRLWHAFLFLRPPTSHSFFSNLYWCASVSTVLSSCSW